MKNQEKIRNLCTGELIIHSNFVVHVLRLLPDTDALYITSVYNVFYVCTMYTSIGNIGNMSRGTFC